MGRTGGVARGGSSRDRPADRVLERGTTLHDGQPHRSGLGGREPGRDSRGSLAQARDPRGRPEGHSGLARSRPRRAHQGRDSRIDQAAHSGFGAEPGEHRGAGRRRGGGAAGGPGRWSALRSNRIQAAGTHPVTRDRSDLRYEGCPRGGSAASCKRRPREGARLPLAIAAELGVGGATGQRWVLLQAITLDWLRYSAREMWDPERRRLVLPTRAELTTRGLRPSSSWETSTTSRSIGPSRCSKRRRTCPKSWWTFRSGRSLRDRYAAYSAWTPRLWNAFWGLGGGQAGTSYRSPRWRVYDQVLVSRGAAGLFGPRVATTPLPTSIVVDGRRVQMTSQDGHPLSFDGSKPRGASDHLPVALVKT